MNAPPKFYAHSGTSVDRERWHLLSEHLHGTSVRAARFLDAVDGTDFGRVAGLLHDLGKYTQEFQARLAGGNQRVNHSTAGAKVAVDRFGKHLGKMLAYCVAGHHSGLANSVNGEQTTALEARLEEQVPLLDPIWEREIALPANLQSPRLKPRDRDTAGFCAAFFIRMLFSALVDADYLDTEHYFAGLEGGTKPRGQHPALGELRERLNAYLAQLVADAEAGPVNNLRQEVLAHARGKAAESPGLFTLTVPTGGGKTLASLAFALDHARLHGLARVIYVIPYMSIIEQTAAVFRKALQGGDTDEPDFVIEHHSTFDEERIGHREARDKLRLAMENWDAPIIVTTAVQFFESLFSNRPSRCRKLHNVANSVVILDEAQTLPLQYLRPCVAALDELARNWRTSVVLCTATQPALAQSNGFTGGFEDVRELAPEPKRLYRTLKRTRVRHEGKLDAAALAERLHDSPQALCIVNTRRHARELYDRMADAEGAAHLTTLMCARHRREKLDAVRERLRNGAPVRLIATSLVEAGVDLDFRVVWRAEAGLESIIQAAGRCNREGRAEMGDVFVFKPSEEEGHKPPPEIGQFADAARGVMRSHLDDPMSLDAINDYFRKLYWLKGDDALDAKDILRLLRERGRSLDFPFETIAGEFRLIETAMVPVIVPWSGTDSRDDTAKRLLEELKWANRPGRIARRLQPYVVQVPPRIRAELLNAGAVEVVRKDEFDYQFVVLSNSDLYRPDTGLTWDEPEFRTAEELLY